MEPAVGPLVVGDGHGRARNRLANIWRAIKVTGGDAVGVGQRHRKSERANARYANIRDPSKMQIREAFVYE